MSHKWTPSPHFFYKMHPIIQAFTSLSCWVISTKPSWDFSLLSSAGSATKVATDPLRNLSFCENLPQQKMMLQTDASFFLKKTHGGFAFPRDFFFIFPLVSWRYVQSVVNQVFVFLGNIWCWKGIKSIKQIMVFKKLSYYIFSNAESRVMAEFSIILRCKIRCPSALVPQIF